jgi:hypothetical protein
MTNFTFNRIDSATYSQWLNYLHEKDKTPPQKQIINGIPRKWCPLYIYQGKYYIFPSPDGFGYDLGCVQISDSTYIEYGGEGPYPYRINAFEKTDSSKFKINISKFDTTQIIIDIYIIDREKGIAFFGNESNGILMVNADNIKLFPIIVDESDNRIFYPDGGYPIRFDKPDVDVLLKKAK